MWVKFFFYLGPILGLGLILCYISNMLFKVTHPLLFWLSYLNVSLMAIVITALAIGLGALYARFDSDNPLKIAGSFGGFVFMILSAVYVVNLLLLQAYPLFRLYFIRFYPLTQPAAKVFIGLSFFLLLICTIAWVYIPLRQGQEAIERYEPE
jgi:ABC-2 type transport system permease protein